MEGRKRAADLDDAMCRDPDAGVAPGVQMCTVYRECQRNQAATMGGQAVDGCGEFMPSGHEGTPEALRCAACECHRNFHRRVLEPSAALLSGKEEGGAGARSRPPNQQNVDALDLEGKGSGQMEVGGGEGPSSSARLDEASGSVRDLAQVTRLSMQALKHNAKVMTSAADSLGLLQQQRGLEMQGIMYAFEQAAVAMGSDLWGKGGPQQQLGSFDPVAHLSNRAELQITAAPPSTTNSKNNIVIAEQQGARARMSPDREPSQRGAIGGTWGNDMRNVLQGAGHPEQGIGGRSHQIVDSSGHMIHLPSRLGDVPDSDRVLADMLMNDLRMKQSAGEMREEIRPNALPHLSHGVSDEERRVTSETGRSLSNRGNQRKSKRIRTKLTEVQKEKMENFAEKVGWTIVGQKKEDVEAACSDIGVAQKTLRYWLHNRKQKMKRPQTSAEDVNQGLALMPAGEDGLGGAGEGAERASDLNQEENESSEKWQEHLHARQDSLDLQQFYGMAQGMTLQDNQPSPTRAPTPPGSQSQ